MAESFLTYRRCRWLWVSLVAAIVSVVIYVDYQSRMLPYGGTWIGLAYGIIGTLIIAHLMALGIRKRAYSSGIGTLQGWTSAHVYMGVLTLILIPMHAGFRFGPDVHTLAFILLLIVVLSGILGVVLYRILPPRLTKFETGLQADKVDKEIRQLLVEMRNLVKDKSDTLVRAYHDETHKMKAMKPKGWSLFFWGPGSDPIAKRSQELVLAVSRIPREEQSDFQLLSQLMLKKTQLEVNLMSQMRLRNAMQAWLYIHLPVSIAMVAAVIIHVMTVFYY